mmetsp:Transcript_23059/g.65547  ORF Transcript_23059/g.65547 Transcript_23059/m.65547 type:complete len:225 (+) Transcript_23059:1118-1792(+)
MRTNTAGLEGHAPSSSSSKEPYFAEGANVEANNWCNICVVNSLPGANEPVYAMVVVVVVGACVCPVFEKLGRAPLLSATPPAAASAGDCRPSCGLSLATPAAPSAGCTWRCKVSMCPWNCFTSCSWRSAIAAFSSSAALLALSACFSSSVVRLRKASSVVQYVSKVFSNSMRLCSIWLACCCANSALWRSNSSAFDRCIALRSSSTCWLKRCSNNDRCCFTCSS